MSILEAYESGEHVTNVAHFAAMVKLANIDGPINSDEEIVLKRLAFKLDVSEEEVKAVLKYPGNYPLMPPYTLEDRIERLNDLFEIINADRIIDVQERDMIYKYAIGLGFSSEHANREIENYILCFGGGGKG